jgi:hypothetical protein
VTKKEPTEAAMRRRVCEIAIDAYVDTSDASEPLDLLIERVRIGVQVERDNQIDLYDEFEHELDEFADLLCARAQSLDAQHQGENQ